MAFVTPKKTSEAATTLSCRVPTPAKTGNDLVDRKRREEYEDLVESVDLLVETPELRSSCVRFLRKTKAELNERRVEGNMDTFVNQSRTLGQFIRSNEIWCIDWLVRQMPAITAKLQAKSKDYDKGSATQQICFLLHAGPSWVMPQECKYVQVAKKLFDGRLAMVGPRHTLLTAGPKPFIDEGGHMSWELGVYCVKMNDDNQITEVLHRPTKDVAVVGSSEGLDRGWGIANNFNGSAAQFVKGKLSLIVASFFPKGKGPHKIGQWSGKLKPEDMETAAAFLKEIRDGVKPAEDTTEVTKAAMDAPAVLMRKQAAAKARAKLEASQAELKRKHVVQV